MKQYGHGKGTVHGGFSQYTIVPAAFAYVLQTPLDATRACLLEPFGVAQHACEEVEVKGDTVLITGCGPIGLFSVGVAKVWVAARMSRRTRRSRCAPRPQAMGATLVIASDVLDERLAIAKKMGADVVRERAHAWSSRAALR
jgi:threonine dehydrogenase-like Zn-dependent dehydrogenase